MKTDESQRRRKFCKLWPFPVTNESSVTIPNPPQSLLDPAASPSLKREKERGGNDRAFIESATFHGQTPRTRKALNGIFAAAAAMDGRTDG